MWRVMQPSIVSHTQNLCFAYRSGRNWGFGPLLKDTFVVGNEGGRECWAFILPTYSTFPVSTETQTHDLWATSLTL